ncbi:unnamed protein product, partial [Closterium sp. NIES-53]
AAHMGGERGEEFLIICASERTDVKVGNRHAPYRHHRGDFAFAFALLYTSLAAVLPRVSALLDIAQGPSWEQPGKLSVIVQEHEQEVRFNPGWLEEGDDRVVAELVGSQMLPLVLQPGRIILTPYSVYFQPFNVVSSVPVVRHPLRTVTAVMRRSTHLQEIGVEIFYSQWSSIYFTFKSTEDCSRFYSLLLQQPGLSIESMRSRDKWVREWVSGGISNFDYLMYLNREANRSFNDLSQYPVFPWVIADYTSKELDLTSPATFRDLRKPVGALNPDRLEKFCQRYDDLAELYEDWAGNFPEGEVPPHVPGTPSPAFLYGCHYSTPGYVVYVRVRDAPQLMLRLQNGRFDMPDRLLSSIPEMWEGAYNNPSDLKELIPEFYSLSTSFLLNSQGLDLGVKQDGVPVGDVVLPPWATDAHDFAAKMRQALECPYVSKRLHHWINLVFGCKQRGEAAVEADNVFHPLTYDDIGAQVLASVEDDTVRQALTVQMREFGRTPKQLFTAPHPRQLRKEVRVIHRYVRTASRAMRLPSLFRQSTVDSHIVVQSLSTLNRVSTHRSHLDSKLKSRRGYKTILMGALNPLVELALPDRSVYRAIAQVAGGEKDREGQEFGLEWLENTAMYREADMLQISSAKYMLPLMPLALSKRTDQRAAAMRAVAALCKPDANRQFVYSAGFLEPIEAAIVGGYDRGTKAAVDAIAKLSVLPEVVEEFSTAGVLSLVDLLVMSDNSLQAVETQALACEALWRLCGLRRHRLPALGRDVLQRLLPLVRAGEHFTVELREMALRALAAVCVETSSQEEMLQRGGLKEVLEICAMEAGNILEAAIAALAALCRNPELRLQIAVEGGLRLLCNASCAAEVQIQEVAASALQSLLGDGVILNGVIREEGLWSIIAMAQSQHHEVQRLAARAFWYLAIHCENKRQVMALGGLQSLLALAALGERNRHATLLAEEALLRLSEDRHIHAHLMREQAFLARTSAAGGATAAAAAGAGTGVAAGGGGGAGGGTGGGSGRSGADGDGGVGRGDGDGESSGRRRQAGGAGSAAGAGGAAGGGGARGAGMGSSVSSSLAATAGSQHPNHSAAATPTASTSAPSPFPLSTSDFEGFSGFSASSPSAQSDQSWALTWSNSSKWEAPSPAQTLLLWLLLVLRLQLLLLRLVVLVVLVQGAW